MNIETYFKGLADPTGPEPLAEIIENIRADAGLKKQIEAIRAEPDKAKRGTLKMGLPAVQVSASLADKGRKVVEHSGLIQLDVDGIGSEAAESHRDKMEYDAHVAAAFISPSGDGLKIIMRIPPDMDGHLASFLACENYMQATYGLAIDPACKDLARICFLSHDPEAWHKPASPLDVAAWTPPAAEPPQVAQTPAANPEEVDMPGTDADRAKLFVRRWKGEVLYVTDRGIWLTWEGRWRKDSSGGITRRAIALADETMARVAAAPATSKEAITQKRAAITAASKLADASAIRAMRGLAEAFTEIQAEAKALDADQWTLGTPNAIIDLRTGEAREHSPGDLVTKFTAAEFDPEATASRWERFIEEIFPDEELRWYAWKALGYAITGSTREKCFHFLIGGGDNGKSKLLECLSFVLGDYAGSAAKGLLYSNDRGTYPLREAAAIVGKRFLVGPETEERDKLNTGLLKRLTGDGDSLDAASLYENQFSFVPCSKLFIMGNHRPGIADTGPAMWRRVRLIPFERVFAKPEQDPLLADKLRAEASGILNWLIRGALLWQREGMAPPGKVTAAVEEYRTDQDTLAEFIEECTVHDSDVITPHSALFREYEKWAEDSGIRFKLSKKGLAKQLRAKGWHDVRFGGSFTNWQGIALRQ